MAKKLIFTESKRNLVSRCDDLMRRLEHVELLLGVAVATVDTVTPLITGGGSQTSSPGTSPTVKVLVAPEALNDFRILGHAFLIEEWHLFLDGVFGGVLKYCLNQNHLKELPKGIMLRTHSIDLETLSRAKKSMRKIINREFSRFFSYEDKIAYLAKKLAADKPSSREYIKKHVAIRNVYQHHRGEVRQDDLEAIGQKKFVLLDENGDETPFGVGDTIQLSKREIKKLYTTIKNYSGIFEVQL